jgi:hypothetical protein
MKFIHKILCHYGKHKMRPLNDKFSKLRECVHCKQVQRLKMTPVWTVIKKGGSHNAYFRCY